MDKESNQDYQSQNDYTFDYDCISRLFLSIIL